MHVLTKVRNNRGTNNVIRRSMRFFLIAAFMTAVLSAGSGCEKKQADANPFFTVWDTPFGVPPFDKIKNGHYKPAIEKGIADHAAEIDSIVANPDAPSFENVIAALDRSGELLKKVESLFTKFSEYFLTAVFIGCVR